MTSLRVGLGLAIRRLRSDAGHSQERFAARCRVQLQGTLDVLVLKTLSWGPRHGYAVARGLQQLTEDVLLIEEGSLYPALHRMEQRKGWVESEWGLSENNRRAKFYKLTPDGRKQLRAEASTWSVFAGAVSKVLTATVAPA